MFGYQNGKNPISITEHLDNRTKNSLVIEVNANYLDKWTFGYRGIMMFSYWGMYFTSIAEQVRCSVIKVLPTVHVHTLLIGWESLLNGSLKELTNYLMNEFL